MTTLILVRHGQSETNPRGEFTGQLDVGLLPLGVIQAEKTAEFITQNYKVNAVYASDLKRAYITGEIIAQKASAEITADKRLREVNAGEWQGKKFTEIKDSFPEEWEVWLNDIGNCRTGKESIRELGDRVCKALCEIAEKNEGKTVVIATHATPIRVATCLLGGFPVGHMKDIPWVSNASATEMQYDNGKWKIVKAGMDEHLKDLKTTLVGKV